MIRSIFQYSEVTEMNDKEQLTGLYKDMYTAMISKDSTGLDAVFDEGFVLVHMTGMRQTKPAFIASVMDGTLNYYSAVHESIEVTVTGDTARLIGKSKVTAAVFGGGMNTWQLRQDIALEKKNGEWKMILSKAGTY